MGSKGNLRLAFYTLCLFQGVTSVERQIFDFLGYMWLPILCNFLNTVFVIFCIFGVWQKRANYVYAYALWTILWVGWNMFLICFYLEAGNLKRTDDLLSFGTGSFSWWLVNGFGCNPEYFHNATSIDLPAAGPNDYQFKPIRPSRVTGCLMEYQNVEVLHAAVNLAFAVMGILLACFYVIELHQEKLEKNSVHSKSLYSIEYSPQVNDVVAQETELYANTLSEDNRVPGHMTPRRVKRRSHTRSSARSNKSLNRARRSSARSSISSTHKNKNGVNPVTRLINQTGPQSARSPDSSTSNEDQGHLQHQGDPAYGQINPAYESSRPNSIYSASSSRAPGMESSRPASALTSYSNFHGQRKPQIGNLNMNVTNLTQETFQQPPVIQESNSFDDLPPPPSPIANESQARNENFSLIGGAQAQVPVPQQRNVVNRRNEYVNMPIQDTDLRDGYTFNSKYNHQEVVNDQTLKAQGHRLVLAEPANGLSQQKQSVPSYSNHPLHQNGNSSTDDYGFTTSNGPALPPKQPRNNDSDKWYLKDSMRPVGSSAHGGNCKCYRCQRKLTAI